MNYDRIILELLERIQDLEARVNALEGEAAQPEEGAAEPVPEERAAEISEWVSPKYRKLAEYLVRSGEARVVLSYPEIEEILGFSLPASSRSHLPQYWANTTRNSYATSWLAVGYKARVKKGEFSVTFEKVR